MFLTVLQCVSDSNVPLIDPRLIHFILLFISKTSFIFNSLLNDSLARYKTLD